MATTEVYERILDELAKGEMEELERLVFLALRRVYPKARTRRGLLADIYGYVTDGSENINNNTKDRKIREAIASLFNKGIPIVSSSGESGYRLDVNLDDWEDMIEELKSRRNSIDDRIQTANKIVKKIHVLGLDVIPAVVPTTAKQLSLLGEREA